jgi:putative glycerol-1-phosphate prenyltransferase
MAGEMLGLSMVYLEAGSGASAHVPISVIKSVRENISVPLAVGGGIMNKNEVKEIFNAGADLIVLGNGCEKNPGFLAEACKVRDKIRRI